MVSAAFKYVPPTTTTFAFSSVFILLLWRWYTWLVTREPTCVELNEGDGGGGGDERVFIRWTIIHHHQYITSSDELLSMSKTYLSCRKDFL